MTPSDLTALSLQELERMYREKVQGWTIEKSGHSDKIHLVWNEIGVRFPNPFVYYDSIKQAKENLPALTDTEYFTALDALPNAFELIERGQFTYLQNLQHDFGEEIRGDNRSDALKKAILIAHLTLKEKE